MLTVCRTFPTPTLPKHTPSLYTPADKHCFLNLFDCITVNITLSPGEGAAATKIQKMSSVCFFLCGVTLTRSIQMCFSTKFGTVLSYLKFSWKKYIVLLAALVLRKTQNVGFALSVLFISKIWSNLNCRFIPVNLLFWDLYFGQVEQKFCGINTAQETSDKVSLLITSQQLTVIKWPDNAFLLYQSTNRWNLQSSLIARDEECCFNLFRYSWNAIKFTSITESCLSKHRMAFSWGPFRPEFQNLLFCALRRRP